MTSASRRAWLQRAEALGRWLENALLTLLLAALIFVAFVPIVLRNVFSVGLPWADGSARLMVLWLAVVGAVAASREGRHISIDLASRYLPERFRRTSEAVTSFFAMSFTGLLAWHAARFVADSWAYGDVMLGGWPAWAFQIVMPIGFALMSYRFALRWLKILVRAS